jgi:hypothetical protein
MDSTLLVPDKVELCEVTKPQSSNPGWTPKTSTLKFQI